VGTRNKHTHRTGRKRLAPVALASAQPFIQHVFGGRVEFLNGSKVPTVFMTREAYSRMYHYVDLALEEVSWLGTVRIMSCGNYLIEEVFLLEQTVSSAQTELSTDGQAILVQHLINTRSDGVEIANRLLFWGHSHVHMGTGPSGQDDQQVEQFRENGCPWFIRGIVNKKGRMEFTIFLYQAGLKIVDAPWAIYEPVDESIRAGIEAEFEEKVSRMSYQHVLPAGIVPRYARDLYALGDDGESSQYAARMYHRDYLQNGGLDEHGS